MDGVVEIIGRERRRPWSTADKLRIVVETHEPGVWVCDVAAGHGLCQSLVFAWRRQVREGLLAEPGMPVFMPMQILETLAAAAQSQSAPAPAPSRQSAGLIGIELGDGRQRGACRVPGRWWRISSC